MLYLDYDSLDPYYEFNSSNFEVYWYEDAPGDTNEFLGAISYFSPPGKSMDWFIFGPITIPAEGAELRWSHWYLYSSWRNAYDVLITTLGNDTASFINPPVYSVGDNDSLTEGDDVWTPQYAEIDKNQYGGQQVYIAFKHYSDDMFYLFLDDFSITDCPNEINKPITAFEVSDTNICTGASILFTDLSANQPDSWLWSFPGGNPESSSEQNPVVSYLLPGSYPVSLTAGNEDGTTAVVYNNYINVDYTHHINMQVRDISCYGANNGMIELSIYGGSEPYNYLWSTGSTDSVLMNISEGLYSVTVGDIFNCFTSDSAFISEPEQIILMNSSSKSNCGKSDGAVINIVSGGYQPYSYSWSNNYSSNYLNNLDTGLYYVTVSDSAGCNVVDSILIEDNPGPVIAYLSSDVDCYGNETGSINTTLNMGTSPFEYYWNNGATTAELDSLLQGEYCLTVSDFNNCFDTICISISEPDSLYIDFSITDESINGAGDGLIDIEAYGGINPYSYLWSNGETTQYIDSLASGIYSIILTDSNGCIIYDTVIVSYGLGISKADINESSLYIYPNPANGRLHVICNNKISELLVYDPLGNVIIHRTHNSKNPHIELGNISPGIYFLRIFESGKVHLLKFIKE